VHRRQDYVIFSWRPDGKELRQRFLMIKIVDGPEQQAAPQIIIVQHFRL
jgi:hypothetical protein